MTSVREQLQDGEYKVYRTSRWMFKYTVVDPMGLVIDVTATLMAAQRTIRRDKAKLSKTWPSYASREYYFWDAPVVYREKGL